MMELNLVEQAFAKIRERAIFKVERLALKHEEFLPAKFVVAGGYFKQHPKDVDIFFLEGMEKFVPEEGIVAKTKNAITAKHRGVTFQFCSYEKSSLRELVRSFDFGICQIGALVKDGTVVDFFFTENYLTDCLSRTATFCGSEYPLSSLIRLQKLDLPRSNYLTELLAILTAIKKRGYSGREDFKDQLDAIDLMIGADSLSPEQQDVAKDYLSAFIKTKTEE